MKRERKKLTIYANDIYQKIRFPGTRMRRTGHNQCDVRHHTPQDNGNPPGIDKNYTDLTGRFPQRALTGNQYILILYGYAPNAIVMEPIKDRTGGEIIKGFARVTTYLKMGVQSDIKHHGQKTVQRDDKFHQ